MFFAQPITYKCTFFVLIVKLEFTLTLLVLSTCTFLNWFYYWFLMAGNLKKDWRIGSALLEKINDWI